MEPVGGLGGSKSGRGDILEDHSAWPERGGREPRRWHKEISGAAAGGPDRGAKVGAEVGVGGVTGEVLEEVAVTLGKVATAVHLDVVGAEGEDLHDNAGLGPPACLAVVCLLVLEEDDVAKGEGRQGAGALPELVVYPPVELDRDVGTSVSLKTPLAPGLVLALETQEVVAKVATEDELGQGDASLGIGVVTVDEERPGKLIRVNASGGPRLSMTSRLADFMATSKP